MDFGIGFLSNNIMLPILDFFYGVVPSYGLAIVALTLVIRFALYPLNAGSIRNMRKMKVANPIMQKRMAEIKERYKDDPVKQQEEIKGIYGEFGNPLAGCFPVVLQMPILFALFATLRGSPFADITLPVNLKIVPEAAIEQVQDPLLTKPSNVFVADGEHFQVSALVPTGSQLAVGDTTQIELRSVDNKSLDELRVEYAEEGVNIAPTWEVTKGQELVAVQPDGTIKAIAPGDITVQAKIPGLAADKGFLFIEKLGRIGVTGDNGEIHWDILGMIIFFGLSLYASQQITGAQSGGGDQNDQQQAIAKFTPVIFSGMFLFFPLPAGVLMYMVIANVFQTAQSFILSKEPLPENLQKLVEAQEAQAASASGDGREQLAFEPGAAKRATKSASGGASNSKGKSAKATDADKPGKPGSKKKVSKKKS